MRPSLTTAAIIAHNTDLSGRVCSFRPSEGVRREKTKATLPAVMSVAQADPLHPGEREPLTVHLTWTGDLTFQGRAGEVGLVLDSHGKAGVSPMQTLAFALAGCMGMDLVHILTKSRTPF